MELDALIADPALGSLLDLASAAAGGAAIAVTAAGGQSLPVCVDDKAIGHVVCDASTPPAVAGLVHAALELAIAGSRDDVTQARAGQELAIGRQIQRSLLPRSFPEVPGWRFAAE